MSYKGIDPNGINQISQSLVSLYVNGERQIDISTENVDIINDLNVQGSVSASIFSGSGEELFNIPPTALTTDAQNQIFSGSATASISPNKGFKVNVDTSISGALNVSESLTVGGVISGDGSGITNINADSIGDIDRLKSGSAEAVISPNLGFEINVDTEISGTLDISGSLRTNDTLKVDKSADIGTDLDVGNNVTIGNDLTVAGKITSTELHTTYLSSSVVYATGSNKFGDGASDKQEFTGSVGIKGDLSVDGNIDFSGNLTADDLPTGTSSEVVVFEDRKSVV